MCIRDRTDTPYKGVLRASDFSRSTSSFFFNETSESIRFDSSFTNNNGDLSFELPFVDGIPQRYYELTLSNDSETIEEGRFLNEYIQYDTIIITGFTHLDLKIRNDSCRSIGFSTLGYQTVADYRRDSMERFTKPDYVARFNTIRSKSTTLSKTLPAYCNKIIVLQIIDQSVFPALLIQQEVLEMEQDSTMVFCVQI